MRFIKYLLPIIVLGLLSVQDVSALTSTISMRCPAELQLTENLRSGAYNGRYHPYTRGIVTQAHILQKHLNRLGFSSGKEDGKLGPISTGAIMRMQASLGTKSDGIVGPNTRAVLNNSCTYQNFITPCAIDVPGCVLPIKKDKIIIENNYLNDFDYKNVPYRVDLNGLYNRAKVFHVYGTNETKINLVDGLNKDYSDIDEDYQEIVVTSPNRIDRVTGGGLRLRPTLDDEIYYFRTCVDTYEDIVCGDVIQFNLLDNQSYTRTLDADRINANSAQLQAYVAAKGYNSSLYFAYSKDERDMDRAVREDAASEISVNYDDVEIVYVDMVTSNGNYMKTINNLDDNEKYYYAACIESNGRFSCGDVEMFKTWKESSNNNFHKPDVQTRTPFLDNLGVRGQAGQLIFEGHSEHNDATNIKKFFVYGHNTEFLDIESNYDSYNEINTNSGIKKTNYSNSLDTNSAATFIKSITPVIEDLNQPNYFSACIEYRDEDNDTQLACGNSRLFDYSDTIENLERQARDAAAKAAVSARRLDIELYNIDNRTYNNAFPYITNLQLNTGNSYSIIYQSRGDTYTQYTSLQSRDDLFCTDSTGFVGHTSSVLFGVSCNL